MTGLMPDIETELDTGRVAELLSLLGLQRLCHLFDVLEARLRDVQIRLEKGEDLSLLVKTVHQSHGSAASLGFKQAAAAIERLEGLMVAAAGDSPETASGERRKQFALILATLLQALHVSRGKINQIPH